MYLCHSHNLICFNGAGGRNIRLRLGSGTRDPEDLLCWVGRGIDDLSGAFFWVMGQVSCSHPSLGGGNFCMNHSMPSSHWHPVKQTIILTIANDKSNCFGSIFPTKFMQYLWTSLNQWTQNVFRPSKTNIPASWNLITKIPSYFKTAHLSNWI